MHTTWRTLRNEIGAHEGLFGFTVSATDCAALLTASPTCEEEFAQVLILSHDCIINPNRDRPTWQTGVQTDRGGHSRFT